MTWKGRGNNWLNVMRSEDGIDWGAKVRLDDESERAPRLGRFDNLLMLSWIGTRDRKINVARSRDGIDF
jgi:hypothetical protein